jgi:hypothetical protein
MKRLQISTAVAASLAVLAFAPMVAHAADRCANPNGSVEERACAMAAQGPEALRRFAERTRGIYNIYFFDFVRPSA